MLPLYAVTLGLGALLLFWVQPMFSKMVLPLLGGSPAVWNIAMVFFQATLLAGYLYAHLGQRYLRPKRQAVVHLILLALAFSALPIAVAADLHPPNDGQPAVWLLVLLTLSVGLPFFALAATAPMLQSWFAYTGHRDAANPYILYAVSNFGSILALLAYPVLLEPVLTLGQQSLTWAVGFTLLALLIGACAWLLLRRYQSGGADQRALDEIGLSAQVDWPRRLHWLALAFVPSALLLGVTQHISTDIASAPLLWVIPLILYLGTYVIVFARRPVISRRVAAFIQVPMVIILALLFFWQIRYLRLVLPLHLTVFFFIALVCHGELAKRRPVPSRLTEFYLWMSLGGVLGGAFTALLAPNIFDTVMEYPLALVAACLLRPRLDQAPMTALKALPLAILVALLVLPRVAGYDPDDFDLPWLLLHLLPMALLAYGCRRRPLLFGLAIAAILSSGAYDDRSDEIAISRGFFGVNRVVARGSGDSSVLVFKHGTTKHGVQYTDPARQRIPLAYYHAKGPMGQVLLALDNRFDQVAVVGLGVGTAACYERPGRQWTFYEIDPLVVTLARDQGHFHYLTDCAPQARIVIGDGRLSLAREAAVGNNAPSFDLLILDAFSSDAIPLHLVTREALAVYLSRLAPGGLIMFHISNRHINLRPVLADLAADAGIVAYVQRNHPKGRDKYHYGSSWVAMARTARDLAPVLASAPAASPWKMLKAKPGRRVWTDDYGNLITITRTWSRWQGDQSVD
ncbi:MAG: fused MFS/spermidine synthase [Rhodospirillaceae bacterium]|jgi:spermidine synthase|nr:fused MFS/spermidine synthase [Rhodospirillaceae bacterium]MBT3780263.1 fused MFS/spermidine synthase [Rhodospirillaceae bacterium]MBT3979378.1 fused MFS/spermidine synthase [Rhodospirillaceae bacterium]MBT4167247.1 fused MFS/spermidine synthase [Rhodospirillaceae bacterium]MBT4564229.1 fused MFS/spermidine synthase [Rhodospirillaceae bacterium]